MQMDVSEMPTQCDLVKQDQQAGLETVALADCPCSRCYAMQARARVINAPLGGRQHNQKYLQIGGLMLRKGTLQRNGVRYANANRYTTSNHICRKKDAYRHCGHRNDWLYREFSVYTNVSCWPTADYS